MSDLNKRFWDSNLEELKRGYISENNKFICLICGKEFEWGVIYPSGDMLYDAERMAQHHIQSEHGCIFHYLLGLDKKLTGLTEIQSTLLDLLYKGLSDQEILKQTGGGSTSTIRAHRFKLREKERQAKVLLVLMDLLNEVDHSEEEFITVHKGATMVDDRYAITEDEYQKTVNTYFKEGRLTSMPARQKRKLMIFRHIAESFGANQQYNEQEVNEKLAGFYSDYVAMRRYLIEYGFLERTRDGSRYWVKV